MTILNTVGRPRILWVQDIPRLHGKKRVDSDQPVAASWNIPTGPPRPIRLDDAHTSGLQSLERSWQSNNEQTGSASWTGPKRLKEQIHNCCDDRSTGMKWQSVDTSKSFY